MSARRRARELADEALAAGEPLAWFEQLYAEAARGDAVVPWDDAAPNPHLSKWLSEHPLAPGIAAVDVGCGTGDNTAALLAAGATVHAFDVSATAVEHVRKRLGDEVTLEVAEAARPPEDWIARFELVVEIYTLQVLPPEPRKAAFAGIAQLVAPGGTLLLVCRGREPDEAAGQLPWPLTRVEIEALARGSRLQVEHFDDLLDDETPRVRRFVVTLRRAA